MALDSVWIGLSVLPSSVYSAAVSAGEPPSSPPERWRPVPPAPPPCARDPGSDVADVCSRRGGPNRRPSCEVAK